MRRNEKKTLLVDTDVIFFFLRGGRLEDKAEKLVLKAENGELELRTSSEVYDDAISALRSGGTTLDVVRNFLADMRTIPHRPLPMTADIAEYAMNLYARYGGPGKLSYFDSFHIATANRFDLKLVTGDRYVLEHGSEMGISVIDLAAL
jgi:predicted nucleic acid-binding protein